MNDVKIDDLFAFSFSIPGQEPVVLCSSNEKERLQWRLAFTYSIHYMHIAGSVKNQMLHKPLAQARLRDMQRIALLVARCKNRLLILPPSFRRVDKSVADAAAATLVASTAALPHLVSTSSLSKLRASSAHASTTSPPSVSYELSGPNPSNKNLTPKTLYSSKQNPKPLTLTHSQAARWSTAAFNPTAPDSAPPLPLPLYQLCCSR